MSMRLSRVFCMLRNQLPFLSLRLSVCPTVKNNGSTWRVW